MGGLVSCGCCLEAPGLCPWHMDKCRPDASPLSKRGAPGGASPLSKRGAPGTPVVCRCVRYWTYGGERHRWLLVFSVNQIVTGRRMWFNFDQESDLCACAVS